MGLTACRDTNFGLRTLEALAERSSASGNGLAASKSIRAASDRANRQLCIAVFQV